MYKYTAKQTIVSEMDAANKSLDVNAHYYKVHEILNRHGVSEKTGRVHNSEHHNILSSKFYYQYCFYSPVKLETLRVNGIAFPASMFDCVEICDTIKQY